jgi:uncharacterized protein (UPF0333 family)
MFLLLRNRKAQSTAEYAIVIGIVIAAALAMQTYVKRGLQGGIKFAVDKAGSSAANAKNQYEPYYSASSYETTATTDSTSKESVVADGTLTRESDSGERSRTGSQATADTQNSD